MKVLYIITKSEAGGAQTHVFQLARFMRSLGHEVGVSAYPGGWLEDEVEKLGCTFFPNPSLSHTINPLTLFNAGKCIAGLVDEFKPDLVSTHSTVAGIVARLAIRNKAPTIFTAHGWGFAKGSPWYRKPITIPAEKLMSAYAERIICVSDQDRELALKYKIAKGGKIITIHNGVEVAGVENVVHHMNTRQVQIIFIGRLALPKDPFLLIDAFGRLSDETKNKAHINIVGDGPMMDSLKGYVKNKGMGEFVSLKGFLPRQDTFHVLAQSDIFVLVSRWEGFPRSVLEAMAFGLPVIASDVGGVREAVTKDSGIILPTGKEVAKEALIRALQKLIEEPVLRKILGERSGKRVRDMFSLEGMCQKTYEVYNKVLGLVLE